MDPMVSARVPAELRDQVNEGLKAIGSSPTELINKAYEFFINTKSLPGSDVSIKPGKRKLSKKQLAELTDSIERTSVAVPESHFQGLSDDELLAKILEEEYEALA